MRTRHAATTCGAIVLAVLLAATAASAGGGHPLLVATGNELTAPGAIAPGRVRCIGGQPTGDPLVPCSPGTRLSMVRGMVSAGQAVNVMGSAAAFFEGSNVITTNCNFDVNLRGQCWGTFEWAIPAKGGRWEGTWMGQFDVMAAGVVYSARAIGRGGDLSGLSLQYEAVLPGWSTTPGVPNPIFFVGEVRDR